MNEIDSKFLFHFTKDYDPYDEYEDWDDEEDVIDELDETEEKLKKILESTTDSAEDPIERLVQIKREKQRLENEMETDQ